MVSKGREVLTSLMPIQSALARALDQGNFALMASSAFDVINIKRQSPIFLLLNKSSF